MKILMVAPYFYPAWAYGGIPRVVYELSQELTRRGHEVTVYTTDVLDRDHRCQESGKRTKVDGVTVVYFRNASNRLAYDYQIFLPLGMRRTVRETITQFDVIHMHGHRNFLNNIVHHYAVRHRIPYVFSGHGTVPIIERRQWAKRIFDIFLGSIILKDAALFIAVSRHEVEQYGNMKIDANSIKTIYNGIDISGCDKTASGSGFKERYGIREARMVLYLGKLTPRKGIDVLVKAFAELGLEDARLVIAGNDMGYQGQIEAIIRERSLSKKVIFTGLLVGKEKQEAYRDADVLVYPAVHEIFGLVPFEAILCGTPVIVTDDCGCGEIIGREQIGFVTRYNDVQNLRDTISKALGDKPAAVGMVNRGKEFIRTHLSWQKIGAEYEEVYQMMSRSQGK
jgi:glycosyltransferase involved in cell wall biosynthesis